VPVLRHGADWVLLDDQGGFTPTNSTGSRALMYHYEQAEKLLKHGDDMQAFVAALGHCILALVDEFRSDADDLPLSVWPET
jgi:hypothetical protein